MNDVPMDMEISKSIPEDGMGSIQSELNPFGTFLVRSEEGNDYGGTSVGSYYHINWNAEQAPIDPILDSMIERLEFMQQTTAGSTLNQKKLFELVECKRKLSLITDGNNE